MRPEFFRRLISLLFFAMLIFPAQANPEFPNRTVKILVGFAPGGTTDLLARIIADELRSMWSTTVVVENRPGADGIVATTALHNAPGDGYTLLMTPMPW
jgi:tripartite-type tricarboxylate transporter receptor subunit TctC